MEKFALLLITLALVTASMAQSNVGNVPKKSNIMELPFIENFDDESCMENWTKTGHYWIYSWQPDVDGGYGLLRNGGIIDEPFEPSYLISSPINFPTAGTYHLSFYTQFWYMIGPTHAHHTLKILYGESPNTAEMKLLANFSDFFEVDEGIWKKIYKNFEISTPGNYYFAFVYCYHSIGWHWHLFDKVEIDAGAILGGAPDIAFRQILLPPSTCNLASENVAVELRNTGMESLSEFTLTYQVNNEPLVTQTFTQSIDFSNNVTVTFNQPIDFSEDKDYHIMFTVETPNEENTYNNQTELTVKAPIKTLPFKSDFSNPEDVFNWYPQTFESWTVEVEEDAFYILHKDNIPLLSRCIMLEIGTYNFTYDYVIGFFDPGGGTYGEVDFYIAYGKSGTDPATWQPAKKYVKYCTYNNRVTDKFSMNITEPGTYELGFFPVLTALYQRYSGIKLYSADLEKTLDISSYPIPEPEFTLYPNPVSGTLYIESQTGITPEVKIYSIQGELLINIKDNRIDFSSYPSGIYIAKINGKSHKIVKQ